MKKPIYFVRLSLVIGAVFLLRVLLVRNGIITGEGIRFADLLVGCSVLIVAIPLVFSLPLTSGSPWTDVVAGISGVIAIVGGVYGISNLAAPVTPPDLSAPACGNAKLWNADSRGLTIDFNKVGVAARTGPGQSFSESFRYPGGCSLGFDYYCVGEQVPDPNYKDTWVDTRWLKVAGKQQFVSAAVIGLLPNDARTLQPGTDKCPTGFQGSAAKAEIDLDNFLPDLQLPDGQQVPGAQILTASADKARNIGFATAVLGVDENGQVGNSSHYRQIRAYGEPRLPSGETADSGRVQIDGQKSVKWDPYFNLTLYGEYNAIIAIGSVPCLAPGFPAEVLPPYSGVDAIDVRYVQVEMADKDVQFQVLAEDSPQVAAARSAIDTARLAQLACSTEL